ncbi:MAG: hypothetical protein WC976_06650 [Caldisericia bacterium]
MNESKSSGTNCVGEPRNEYGFCVGAGGQGSCREPVPTKDDLLRRVTAARVSTAHLGGE